MFCPACQQDVPALAVPEEPGVIRCAFCSEELEMRAQETGVRSQESGFRVQESALADEIDEADESVEPEAIPQTEQNSHLPPRLDLEDWELEPQLRAAERLLKGLRQEAPAEQVSAVHAAHPPVPDWHVPEAPTVRSAEAPQRRQTLDAPKPAEKGGTLAWTCLSLGVMALACGGVLIAWSLIAGRDDLWSIGLPLAVVGQGALVIGLLLQLDGLWQTSKKTEETLTHLDGKLHDLAHTTTMLGTTRSTPAQSFYVHMAEGASPHLLLADLKGQLDLLAERMARK
jgi:hypothetical protein